MLRFFDPNCGESTLVCIAVHVNSKPDVLIHKCIANPQKAYSLGKLVSLFFPPHLLFCVRYKDWVPTTHVVDAKNTYILQPVHVATC
jgi:hypothetical protein